ncbi:uncharacterized protein [Penaeus vannamei]|uniref:uncharacterized protein n=1 Tax=Penaeus vannamei TaxID=6689 RepID=UPI00387F4047
MLTGAFIRWNCRRPVGGLPHLLPPGTVTITVGRPWVSVQPQMHTPGGMMRPSRESKGNWCVDDTLIYDYNVEDAFWHAYQFPEMCAMKGITLKPEKFKFCRRELDFVRFHVGWDSYKTTDERLAAIRNFSMPETPSLTDIRSWYGFVNQLAPFLATAPIMEPFRELLQKPQGKRV